MYGQLGAIQFEGMKSFNDFSEKRSGNYAEHARIMGKPKLQQVGKNLNEITFGMRLHAGFCVPEDEIDALNDYVDSGEIVPLILGNGRILGNFVVLNTSLSTTHAQSNGDIVEAEIQVSLKESFEPEVLQTIRLEAVKIAIGIDRIDIKEVAISAQALTPPGVIAEELKQSKTLTDRARGLLDRAKALSGEAQARMAQAKKAVDAAKAKIENYRTLVTQGIEAYNDAQEMIDSATDAIAKITTLSASLDLQNLNQALSGMNDLQNSMNNLTAASVPFVAQRAARAI